MKQENPNEPKRKVRAKPYGYQGEYGLKIAKEELLMFEEKFGRLPKANEFGGIKKAILRGKYRSFGITSWNDLLRETFGRINVEREVYTPDQQGLEKAIATLQAIEEESGKRPAANDKKCSAIHKAIYRKKWVKFDIYKWNDLMSKAFGQVSRKKPLYTADKVGLEQALKKLQAFEAEQKRLPKSTDKGMSAIKSGIHRKRWVQFGIKTWNDLLRKAFKES